MEKYIPYGHQYIDDEDIEEVIKALKEEWITTGPNAERFEKEMCNYLGTKYAVAVNSGTSALDIAVKSLGLPKGSEIITTPFTFAATSNSILFNNLIPVFVDIEKESRNINPEEIRKKITKKTRAILYVDYAGNPCKIKEIKEIAERHNLYLIEDACHALGSEYFGKKIGNFADMTIFSFHPVKTITTGEGGIVVTNNEHYYPKLKLHRSHGINTGAKERAEKNIGYKYDITSLDRNYRITDFQCALGTSQLKKLDSFIEKRRKLFERYKQLLSSLDILELPLAERNSNPAWHLYTVLLKESISRDRFYNYMRDNKIGVNVHYIPIYNFTLYRSYFNITPKDFPITEEVYKKIITLPLYPALTYEEQDRVVKLITNYVEK